MAYKKQTTTNSMFITWGEPKGDNSFVVKEDEAVEGVIQEVNENETFKYVYRLATKKYPEPLVLLGTTVLNKLLGHAPDNGETHSIYPVQAGDKVRITYKGKVKVKNGKQAYTFDIEVDDESESYKEWQEKMNGKKNGKKK